MMTDRHPKRSRLLVFGLFILAGTGFSQTAQQSKKKTVPPAKPSTTIAPPAIEQKAVDLLKATSDRLAGAHTLAFTAVESYESPSRQVIRSSL